MSLSGIKKALKFLGTIANTAENSDREKVGHGFLIYTGALMSLGGLLWGSICFISGLHLESLIPYGYTVITAINFSYLYYSKDFKSARFVQMAISVLLPFLFQLSLGGFIPSGAVILWSILSILVGFTFQNQTTTRRWFLFYILLVMVSGFIEAKIFLVGGEAFHDLSTLFFTLNLCVISSIIFIMFSYFFQSSDNLRLELEKLAQTDPLTNIPNRRHIFDIMEKEFNRVRRNGGAFSVMMIDIDFFKKVNDHFGHGVGDEVLKSFSHYLNKCVRQIDSIGRYGGEEFIVFLPDTSLPEALGLAQRINLGCRDLKLSTPLGLCTFTISIGISVWVKTDTHIDEIIHRADQALYQAKHNGRDQVKASDLSTC